MNLMTDLQTIEAGRQHTVFVKIKFPPVRGQKKTMIFRGKQTGDPSHRQRLVGFDLAAPAPRVVLEFPSRSIESVADGDIKIFMGGMFAGFM